MQHLIGEPAGRITPIDETVSTFEVEAMAERKLDSLNYALIAGSERVAFERITFRPRMMVNTTKLDLTLNLFGASMFAPILAGPIARQKRFHPEGELAAARGVAAAKALMVVSDRSGFPIDQIAAQAKTGFWYQIFPDSNKDRVHQALAAGCKAVCLTLSDTGWDWKSIDALRQNLPVPLLLKGIMNADEAGEAVRKGIGGIVVSNYTGTRATGLAASMEVLPGIADAVGGRIPILIDGSFRRGSDILMALALGAQAVLVGRPVAWGLAAYGAEGVQHVMEMLQTELGRDMAMCGRVNLKAIDRSAVRSHKW